MFSKIIKLLKEIFLIFKSILDFIQNYFKTILFIFIILFIVQNMDKQQNQQKPNLAKIYLQSAILDAKWFVNKVDKLIKDKNIKGVLFIIDSPGGAVAPSIEMSYAIKELTKYKKVVAYANGTLASGSYYASIWADKIIVNPGSTIGSIGVIFQTYNIESIIKKLGISTQIIKAGKYKEVGTGTREWKDFEKKELKKLIQDTYKSFISDVANARKLDIKKEKDFADAHIFTANQAKKVGLIDEIGTIYKARKILQNFTKLKDNEVKWEKEEKKDSVKELIKQFVKESSVKFFNNILGDKLWF